MTKSTPQLQIDLAAIQAEIKRREEMQARWEALGRPKMQYVDWGFAFWHDVVNDPCWDWERHDYRVKPAPPKPRRGTIEIRDGTLGVAYAPDERRSTGFEHMPFIELTPAVEACLREHGEGLL